MGSSTGGREGEITIKHVIWSIDTSSELDKSTAIKLNLLRLLTVL